MRERFTRREFLDALFGDYFRKRDGFLIVKTAKGVHHQLSTRFFPNTEVLAKEQYQPDQEVFFGVCPREATKPGRAHIRHVTALWAGIDLGPSGYCGKDSYFDSPARAAKAVRSFPSPPSIIVESGHGMHLYWLFRDAIQIPDPLWAEHELRRLNAYFQCKREVPIDAMLRLPGTYNFKVPSHRVLCEVKYLNTDFRYTPEDFEAMKLATDVETEASVRLASAGSANDPMHWPQDRSERAEREAEKLAMEPEQYREADLTGRRKLLGRLGNPVERGSRQSGKGRADTRTRMAPDDFEPLPYELEGESQQSSARAIPTGLLDALADKVADKVAEKLTDKLMNDLVERIVNELAKRLLPG
jgi:hypothetical protein